MISCEACQHRGVVTCKKCRGGTHEILCPDCDGRGYSYDVDFNVEDCCRCLGDGYLSPDELSAHIVRMVISHARSVMGYAILTTFN